jgi:predicted house-cleaning noncanonical NTP pyrophosphatase (MazG superfamily)
MITKAKLKEQIKNFPEEFTIDELIDRLLLIEKIERGNQQSQNCEEITEAELEKEMNKWFK